ncbi:hypothetical protein BaRGS_00033978, partial [Batillaria attramentaria]
PFIQQTSYLTSILEKFVENVDPIEDSFVDRLIAKSIFHADVSGMVRNTALTRGDRARKLWDLLGQIHPDRFFKTVKPTLEEFYMENVIVGSRPLTPNKENPMCLRDVVEHILPLKKVADRMVTEGCIRLSVHRDLTKPEANKRERWKQLFQTLKQAEPNPLAVSILEHFMTKCGVPTPYNLIDLLSDGFPCRCRDPGNEDDYRMARLQPPPARKIFRPEDFKAIDDKARAAPAALRRSFDQLISYLTEGLTRDVEKVRAIFTWVGAQHVTSGAPKSGLKACSTPEAYIREVPKNNAYITLLFARLCREAGIPSIIVRGKSKCGRYEAGKKDTLEETVWAIVYAGGDWRFVHPQWAFESVQDWHLGGWLLIEQNGKSVREKVDGKTVIRVHVLWDEHAQYVLEVNLTEKPSITLPEGVTW